MLSPKLTAAIIDPIFTRVCSNAMQLLGKSMTGFTVTELEELYADFEAAKAEGTIVITPAPQHPNVEAAMQNHHNVLQPQ